ncbi:MAG: NAD(P)/FAD-dependent oxidoreductase [Thermodesulfobacteriota bacterium]
MKEKKAIIIGAGPAGLTAAYELLQKTDIKPCIYERSNALGGLAKTVSYKGNRLDIGGHRFFSKSSRIMEWWLTILPPQEQPALDDRLLGRKAVLAEKQTGADPEKTDLVMLIRKRVSRYFFQGVFFDYPLSLTWKTVRTLGWLRVSKIILSYLRVKAAPRKPVRTLEDFLISRFGRELYTFFFQSYTEKVWGVPCDRIPALWGAQRIKGLSMTKALLHAAQMRFGREKTVFGHQVETSLIEHFFYPKYGPGQLWEEVARQVEEMGGEIHRNHEVVGLHPVGSTIDAVRILNTTTGESFDVPADYVFSTMPVQELIRCFPPAYVPAAVAEIARGLRYRDFITIGLLVRKLTIVNDTPVRTMNNSIPDNWIYIPEQDVRLGRMQIYNNWSPYLVKDPGKIWVGLEYFCNEGDRLWSRSDRELIDFAVKELVSIKFLDPEDVLDATIIREAKTYPAYFGSYDRFAELRSFTDRIANLFLVGRNGMHRYNNMDHSMLTAMIAVQNIIDGNTSKENIWQVNTEQDYHEES